MTNTPYSRRGKYFLSKDLQMERVRRAIYRELTPLQKETLLSYYIHRKTIPQIAAERSVNKSTVQRTLRRAENRLRRCLKY
ncbi:MAG: sigma-70 family RNA polymerase sigma factor [Ruminococcaceae bacterium]|nr:sigma-70 family RNA polymerase sigma factor [Oscillospiraceae bacterium]